MVTWISESDDNQHADNALEISYFCEPPFVRHGVAGGWFRHARLRDVTLDYRVSWICNCTAHDGAVLCRMGSPIIGTITTVSTVYKAPKKAIPEPLLRQKFCTGPMQTYMLGFSMSHREKNGYCSSKLITVEEFDQHNYSTALVKPRLLVQVLVSYETDKAYARVAYCCANFGSSTLWMVRVGSNELFSKKRPSVSQH